MTVSPERLDSRREHRVSLDDVWHFDQERRQEAVMPNAGRVLVSCSALLGSGGLGRHLQEILGALARGSCHTSSISGSLDGSQGLRPRPAARLSLALTGPPARVSRSWRTWRASVGFDMHAAIRLSPAEHLIAFNGQALNQLRVARTMGFESVALVSANSHVRHLVRRHDAAHRQYPLERSWASRLVGRNLLEYDQADRIYVASRYVWESFLAEGVPEERLALFPLTPAPRFRASQSDNGCSTFDIVYVGGLSVIKGVPLLIEAVARLAHPDLRLVLVGGAGTRGMRRYLAAALSKDARIAISPGDPLPHLRQARLCVHPAYEDGFAYAPAEALACGVPLIVSADTGMKELIGDGQGLVVPSGDVAALAEAIDAAYRGVPLGG
jgi:glycosyltransferase involved in cell wall biosynthesis